MTNIRVKQESLFDWRSSLKESSECQCEGCGQNPCVECGDNCHDVNEGVKTVIGLGLLAAPYLLKKFVKPKVDKKIEDARDNLNIGGNKRSGTTSEELQGGVSVEPYTKDTKFLEVETVDIIKPKALNASDWRSELDILGEGNRTKGFLGSGNRKDHSKGPNEKIYVDYTKIRANAPVKTDTKVG